MKQYFLYIVTNPERHVLYTGITSDLPRRLYEHYENKGVEATFAGKYHCYCLIYYERYEQAVAAIAREKEIKGWRRQKKLDLIATTNPDWTFLNGRVCGSWPPIHTINR